MFREVEINNALEKEIQPDNTAVISIDAYNGCQLQCPYCFQMNNKEWSCNIDVRINIADMLRENLKELEDPNTELFVGSLSDPYMDIEKEYGLTRKILEVLKDTTFRVYITTKAVNGLILRDLELLRSFKVKPVILLGLSHIVEASKGASHCNIEIAQKLSKAGIPVRVFLTPVLPYVMNVDEMIEAISEDIPIYLDKLRVFEKGNQNVKIYNWIKNDYPMYEQEYHKILFEADEKYYYDLVHKYKENKQITFMSELWSEN